jgi:hypothetical protein
MSKRYDDEDFLQYIPLDPDVSASTNQIAGRLDCTWQTVNRRLTAFAEENDALEVYDPRNETYLTEKTNTGRLFSFSASAEFVEQHNE